MPIIVVKIGQVYNIITALEILVFINARKKRYILRPFNNDPTIIIFIFPGKNLMPDAAIYIPKIKTGTVVLIKAIEVAGIVIYLIKSPLNPATMAPIETARKAF